MDPQLAATALAWVVVLTTGLIAWVTIRTKGHIHWSASAAFAIGALALAIAAAISATEVLRAGPRLSEEARWLIIFCRAIATTLFLGVAMDLTGRPRWVGRVMDRLTGGRS